MSWDLAVLRFARTYTSVEEIDDDAEALPLGSLEQVKTAISIVFGAVDWDDPGQFGWCGVWDNGDDSIEFVMANTEPVEHLGLSVRGGDAVVPGILDLAGLLDAQALDVSDGCFLTADQAVSGLAGLQDFRDQAIRLYQQPGDATSATASPTPPEQQ